MASSCVYRKPRPTGTTTAGAELRPRSTPRRLRKRYWFKTPADLYLWVHYKLRELRTIERHADWDDAAKARDAEKVSREHKQMARQERRKPLPPSGQA